MIFTSFRSMAEWLRVTRLADIVNSPDEKKEICQALIKLADEGLTPTSYVVAKVDADDVNDLIFREVDTNTQTVDEWDKMYREIPQELIQQIADDQHDQFYQMAEEHNDSDLGGPGTSYYIRNWMKETGREHWLRKETWDV